MFQDPRLSLGPCMAMVSGALQKTWLWTATKLKRWRGVRFQSFNFRLCCIYLHILRHTPPYSSDQPWWPLWWDPCLVSEASRSCWRGQGHPSAAEITAASRIFPWLSPVRCPEVPCHFLEIARDGGPQMKWSEMQMNCRSIYWLCLRTSEHLKIWAAFFWITAW